MIVFAESSAILSWMLQEEAEADVRRSLSGAETIVASELTLIECERVILRAVLTRRLENAQASMLRKRLRQTAGMWSLVALGTGVLERSKQAFPVEPVRTLEALHLATALEVRSHIPDLAVLSLDHRIRSNAEALGFELLPR